MLTDNERKSPLLSETSEEKREERKNRNTKNSFLASYCSLHFLFTRHSIMLTDNEGKSPMLLETFEEKQTERKKRILGIPFVILAVIASLARILNVGKNFEMNNSTPVGASSISTMGIGNGLGSTFLSWSSGWRVLLVGNFRGGCSSHGHTSSWDPVANTHGGYRTCSNWGTIIHFKVLSNI